MRSSTVVLAMAIAATLHAHPTATGNPADAESTAPLALTLARVTLDGTSNVHDYAAASTAVRLTAVEVGGTSTTDVLDHVLTSGGLKTFEIAIPAASLTSPKEGIDKNMHKALKVKEHADIRFRLKALEAAGAAYRATGWLTIAGVEKEVTLDLQVRREGLALKVSGGTELLMTDFGVTPPKALMGMVRTNSKVQIRLDLVLVASLA